ncbi:hypothetical protein [Candidatus Oleimmundimicrobium sp.]|uniref:hypothetical protein n=1 Tax=Candidatus Oleimmundimicrobium sp. TaxID=3060597 RepID=UPI00271FD357|nr:hypothetical protein [Candidatus Oleimmundimicrobium sp.]MDO8886570.1 hypothetical protein [Candidatus Oleimmundimicrobium sp.]
MLIMKPGGKCRNNKANSCKIYEGDYPFYTPFLRTILNIIVFLIGAYIIFSEFGMSIFLVYFAYCLIAFFYLMNNRCVRCYYHGKFCSTGIGKVAGIYKKDTVNKFIKGQWQNIFLFLVPFIPFVTLIVLIIFKFTWHRFFLLLLLFGVVSLTLFEHLTLGCTHCYEGYHCITKYLPAGLPAGRHGRHDRHGVKKRYNG